MIKAYALFDLIRQKHGAFFFMCDTCTKGYKPPVLVSGTHRLDCIGAAENQTVRCQGCDSRIQSLENKEKNAVSNFKGKRHASN